MVDPDNNHENDTPHSSDGSIISSRPWVMDYVDVNGLSNRMGLSKDRFIEFIVKETVDNALDFMEQKLSEIFSDNLFMALVSLLNVFSFKICKANPRIEVSDWAPLEHDSILTRLNANRNILIA